MTEIEKTKAEIKMLEKKLSFLEELERTKTPCEEAYKKVFGFYPKGRGDGVWTIGDQDVWSAFQAGYNSAYAEKEVEVEEEPQELKTLYQMLNDEEFRDDVCYVVKEWMSQYTHNVMSGEYLKGYEECLTVLKENLK